MNLPGKKIQHQAFKSDGEETVNQRSDSNAGLRTSGPNWCRLVVKCSVLLCCSDSHQNHREVLIQTAGAFRLSPVRVLMVLFPPAQSEPHKWTGSAWLLVQRKEPVPPACGGWHLWVSNQLEAPGLVSYINALSLYGSGTVCLDRSGPSSWFSVRKHEVLQLFSAIFTKRSKQNQNSCWAIWINI